tara:strand:+ start:747 stop:986 length:240 start_codon:yes stop_codon:yes gene_type:complete
VFAATRRLFALVEPVGEDVAPVAVVCLVFADDNHHIAERRINRQIPLVDRDPRCRGISLPPGIDLSDIVGLADDASSSK